MNTMYEALARDRIREREQRSREAAVVRGLAAQQRWQRVSRYAHRVSRYARAAESRHAVRVDQGASR